MGRHREFDVEKALDGAMGVFWRKGFEGASYKDLTQAAGVQGPALYSAFGNKQDLFKKALELYYDRHMPYFTEALQLPTAYEVAEHILYHAIDLYTQYSGKKGCLCINGGLAGSDVAKPIRQALIEARTTDEVRLRNRFKRAKAACDLPEHSNPHTLAAFVMTVLHGLAVQALGGMSRGKLEDIAGHALSTWPSGPSKL